MNTIEGKFDKILRRLSSKSRRAARRINRPTEDSSSGSDQDDLNTQQTGNPKIDRKNGISRRVHQKLFVTSTTSPTTEVEINTHPFSEAIQVKQEDRKIAIGYPSEQVISDNQLKPQLSPATQLPNALLDDVNLSAQDKTCEWEDGDYISDYSTYGQRSTTRKSVNELDMSMDESLPESCGRESGYLSGVDIRYSASTAESPALSPHGVLAFIRQQPLFQRTLETNTKQSFDDEPCKKRKGILKAVAAIPRRFGVAGGEKLREEEAEVPDYESTEQLLRESIAETKYITTIFELSSGGIVGLVDDVLNEFSIWFGEEIGLMGIACEVQWSVPEKHRHRASETRMKEALHRSLQQNNRRVLNMKSKNGNYQLPLTMISAITEENCARDCHLDCFQGVYRRFYTSLLPYQHADTGVWHRPYWNLRGTNRQSAPQPNPKQFIFGRDATKLDSGSLVAVNVVALKIVI